MLNKLKEQLTQARREKNEVKRLKAVNAPIDNGEVSAYIKNIRA